MAEFEISTNAGAMGARLRRFPAFIAQYLTPALDASADRIARTAKRNVENNGSMAYSTLRNSINKALSANGLEGIIKPNVSYARYVEEGTRGGGYPPVQTIIDWLRVKQIQPRTPGMSEKDLAFLISRDIALNGTPAKPFMQPAFESEKAATLARLDAAIQQALKAVG